MWTATILHGIATKGKKKIRTRRRYVNRDSINCIPCKEGVDVPSGGGGRWGRARQGRLHQFLLHSHDLQHQTPTESNHLHIYPRLASPDTGHYGSARRPDRDLNILLPTSSNFSFPRVRIEQDATFLRRDTSEATRAGRKHLPTPCTSIDQDTRSEHRRTNSGLKRKIVNGSPER